MSKKDTLLIIFEVQNEKFPDTIIDQNKFSIVKMFDNWVFRDLFLKRSRYKKFVSFCKKLRRQSEEFTVFSSIAFDITLLLMSIVKVQKLYLMDDGLGHFTNYYFYRSPARFLYVIKLLVKSFIYGRFLRFRSDFIYFTEHDFIIENTPNAVRYKIEKVDNPLRNLNENEAIFLGTALVEANMINLANYIKLLSDARIVLKHKTIFYYPHRREEISKLESVKNLGFVIKKIDVPFENYFSKLETCPSVICSFYTTAVIRNIAARFNKTPNLKVIKFNKNILLKSQKEYEAVFHEIRNIKGIEIINLKI